MIRKKQILTKIIEWIYIILNLTEKKKYPRQRKNNEILISAAELFPPTGFPNRSHFILSKGYYIY